MILLPDVRVAYEIVLFAFDTVCEVSGFVGYSTGEAVLSAVY